MPNFSLEDLLNLQQDPSGFRMQGVEDPTQPNPDMPMQAAPQPAALKAPAPQLSTQTPTPDQAGMTAPQPDVQEYIKKKFNLGDYSDENRKALTDQVNEGPSFGTKLSAAAAALGTGLMGGGAAAAGQGVLSADEKMRQGKLAQFDKGRSNTVEQFGLDQAANKEGMDDQKVQRENSLNSPETKLAQTLAKKMVPNVDFSGMSARQINEKFPALKEIYDGEQKHLDRQEQRDERRFLAGQSLADKREARSQKDAELSSTQAKQRGLYESGKMAEDQYAAATADKKDYDPTGVGQVIDNSQWAPNWLKNNNAIKAQNAESAWVESYLRDASGAAIPPSERMSYAKDFFPQPGEPEDSVANKAMLRRQKMENARVGAGGDLKATHLSPMGGQKRVVKKQVSPSTGKVKLTYSDGTEEIQ